MISLALTFLSLASMAVAAVTAPMSVDSRISARQTLSGKATYYDGSIQVGACSFSTYTLPSGLYSTALSDANWDTAANCGGCVAVTYGSNTVTAMIVDECPGCGSNHLDLSPEAFSVLAPQPQGVIDVTWDYVPCPHISGGLDIHMMAGVTQYWFAAQVINAHRRTDKLEASTDQGASWTTAERTSYNFFLIKGGVGASTAWIRVTSHVGTQVVVKDVPMQGDVVVTAGDNYA